MSPPASSDVEALSESGSEGSDALHLRKSSLTQPPALRSPTTASNDTLQSAEQRKVLNIVDSLRQCGLDGILSLPQLVVCGDQSSGKSSVLEAITEIPFSRKENLCTRFATEIVLRRDATSSIATKIIADKARSKQEQRDLERFKQSITDFEELPSLIDAATKAMGIGDDTSGIRRAFAKDILVIEICGPSRPQLTLVDLPGLIHTENKAQSSEDVELVAELVQQYIAEPLTIILPIVSAKNDYANQIILKRAREVDPNGSRTLGIITKPDDLPPGSENESAFVSLARNEDIFFALGWHILKNRGYHEHTQTFAQRNHAESKFFSQGIWCDLPTEWLGIEALRTRLSELLFLHIVKELPHLRTELNERLEETVRGLQDLGEKRSTATEQREYLMKLSMTFYDIAKASVNGHYEAEFFGKTESFEKASQTLCTRRLRAMIQYLNLQFARRMREQGQKYKIEGLGTSDDATPMMIYFSTLWKLMIWRLPPLLTPFPLKEIDER